MPAGYCNIANSKVFTRKCRDVFEDQNLVDFYGQGPFWVHQKFYCLTKSENKCKELTSWDNLEQNICLSLGCCSLTNVSTGINECTMIPRDHGITRTSGPLKFHMVSQKRWFSLCRIGYMVNDHVSKVI